MKTVNRYGVAALLGASALLGGCGGGSGNDSGSGGDNEEMLATQNIDMPLNVDELSDFISVDPTTPMQESRCEIDRQPEAGELIEVEPCLYRYQPRSGFLGDDQAVINILGESYEDTAMRQRFEIHFSVRLREIDLEALGEAGVENVVTFRVSPDDYSPRNDVAALGDFNGDGRDDFGILYKPGETSFQQMAVIYGRSQFDSHYNLLEWPENMAASQGHHFQWQEFLWDVSTLGDFNADGYDDIAIGDRVSVTIFGAANPQDDPYTEIVDHNNTDAGLRTATFNAIVSGESRYNTRGVGDVNGDGATDLAMTGVEPTEVGYGQFFVVPGGADVSAIPSTDAEYGIHTFQMVEAGYAGDSFGWIPQDGFGDVNGDGIDDLLTAELSMNDQAEGRAYLFYGHGNFPRVTTVDTFAQTIAGGTVITSTAETGTRLGRCLAIVNDLNGDGLDEIALAQAGNDDGSPGRLRIIYGSGDLPQTLAMLSEDTVFDQAPNGGFSVIGSDACRALSVGDVNGDGYNDLAVMDTHETYISAGSFTLIYGGPDIPAELPLYERSNRTVLFYTGGVSLSGFTGEVTTVAGVGDVNGDGFDDMLVPTRENENNNVILIPGGSHFSR
ncbi:FG-GAP repeat domain-containing protein [Microbulbifer litoralis]|uniref:FG-GAP repeat domain-containing protein n=1 Tax=Microbulbifer litoralis TaxID=2933965 RepID=UPI0020296A00|nr:VCBS repeat-containing protein [Microbulbifer sp. GX H0434]